MEAISLLIIGIILFTAGIGIRYIVGKSRFKRRTIGGMQTFKTYNQAIIIPLIENILALVSVLMILGGVFLIGLWFYNRK